MAEEHLARQTRGQALRLYLNRPQRRNALTVELAGELADAIVGVREQPDVRAIVLSGVGKSFCAGGDIESLSGVADAGGARAVTDVIYTRFHRLVRALAEVSVPVDRRRGRPCPRRRT